MSDPPSSPRTHRAAGPGAAIFTLVVLGAGVLVGSTVNLTPPLASMQSVMVDGLFNTMLGIAAAIFLLVEGVLLYAVLRFRRRPGHEGEGVPIHGSNRLEVAWTVIPALIVFWLAVYSSQILVQLHRVPADALLVQVTARQFNWEFEYPQYGVRSPELHVVEAQPVSLELHSTDVIHSFWVPAFRIKQDALPGMTTRTTFTARMPGRYPVVCAELCGAGHAIMHSAVIVHDRADFEAWLQEAGQ